MRMSEWNKFQVRYNGQESEQLQLRLRAQRSTALLDDFLGETSNKGEGFDI